jgi:ABC-type polysaccharide/polyol phosphate export permease
VHASIGVLPQPQLKEAAFPGRHFLRNLVAGRTLLYQLVRRDFEKRFVGSVAGWLWGIIHPLVLLASWTFVFQICLKQEPLPGEVTSNYTVFLFCGFLPWLLFQDTVTRSASSIIENSNLITKTVFPSEIIPVSIFLSSLVSHLLALFLAVSVVGFWYRELSPMALLLPIYMVLLGLFAIGIGWVVASLQVYLRDTAQIVIVVMTLWFWATPIFISEGQIPEPIRFIVRLNPLAYLVRAYRERLLSYRIPDLSELAVLTIYSVVAFILGGLFFRHLKRGFADVL